MQLALFDFDHTITHCDTYSRFLRRIATPAQLAKARWTLGPWLLGYRAGLVSAAGIRARATRFTLSGRDAMEIAEAARRYAAEALPGMVRSEVLRRIDWHRRQGHRVAIVSASLDLYLQPWCDSHGLELLCNGLETADATLTGRYAGRDIGPHKAQEIRIRYDLRDYERIHAYGDSREDRSMLALAHERWYRGVRVR